MRKLVYAINSTLDGSLDHTNGAPDEETYGYYTEIIRGSDVFIYGRKTYELMVPYWPDVANNPDEPESDREFGRLFVSKKKVVFSRTLQKAAEADTKILRTGAPRRGAEAETGAGQLPFDWRRGYSVAADRAWTGG